MSKLWNKSKMPMKFIRLFYCLNCDALNPLWREKCRKCRSKKLVKVSIEISNLVLKKKEE